MTDRERELTTLQGLLKRHPVVAIIGARQVGKTTLARMLVERWSRPVEFYDLEDPDDATRLADPMLGLRNRSGLVVIDEVQRHPDLFSVLRVLADRSNLPCRFLILGSASPELLKQSAESLAGRIAYHYLAGFALDEVGTKNRLRLWHRGGLPRSFHAKSEETSMEWRRGFVRTFLERDLPQLGIRTPSATMRRFWTMLAHYHGQIWNASEFARSFGVADTTVRGYLDSLTLALVVRQLLPWHENLSKRQVKAPKVYISDSGLLHALLNLPTMADLEAHPKVGASWEGFVLDQIVRRLGAEPEECYFWATYSGAELDLLIVRGSQRRGFEIKLTSAPRLTPGMRVAFADLRLNALEVIHGGEKSFPLADGIDAVALGSMLEIVRPLR